jgi:uncharacterized protein YjdB
MEASYRAFLATGDTAAMTQLRAARTTAFRDAWENGTMSSFWRRLEGDIDYAPTNQLRQTARLAFSNSNPIHKPLVAFINGIQNDPGDAITSWVDLSTLAFGLGYNSTYKYNPTWSREVGGGFWNCVFGRSGLRALTSLFVCNSLVKDVAEANSQLANVLAGEPNAVNSFALSLRDWIVLQLDLGQSLLLVGHSQGNLMVQEALARFFAQRPAAVGAAASKCIAIVSVAAPTSTGFPNGVDVEGTIAKGGVTQDILLTVPALNKFPTTSSNVTVDADLGFALGTTSVNPSASLNLLWMPLYYGVKLHSMTDSYLAGDLTRDWLRTRIGLLGGRIGKNCSDLAIITPGTLVLTAGDFSDLAAERFTPSGKKKADATFTWSSTDASVLRVETSPTGRVTAMKPGVATVTASSGDAVARLSVTVLAAPPSIALTPTAIDFAGAAGGSNPPTQTVQVINAGSGELSGLSTTVTYVSGEPTGWLSTSLSATQAPATITLTPLMGTLAAGSYHATLAVRSGVSGVTNSPKNAVVTLTVTTGPTAVASVAVSPSTASIPIGGTQSFTAKLTDVNGTTLSNRTITWSSNAQSVATVNSSSGVATAVAAGTATITATSEGRTGTGTLTVTAPVVTTGALVVRMSGTCPGLTEGGSCYFDMAGLIRGPNGLVPGGPLRVERAQPLTLTSLSPGTYTVAWPSVFFGPWPFPLYVFGFAVQSTPTTATVVAGGTVTTTGVYSITTGTIRLSAAGFPGNSCNGVVRIIRPDGTDWATMAVTTGVPAGTETVSFNMVPGQYTLRWLDVQCLGIPYHVVSATGSVTVGLGPAVSTAAATYAP